MTVVRDGDFLGVVAPTERAAARAAAAIQATWNVPAGQPSSETHLRLSEEESRSTPCAAAIDTIADARRRRAHVRSVVPDSLHRARAARAARRRRGVAGRQADGLDRHAASVRRAHRAGRGVPHSRGSRPRDRARHGIRRTAASTPARPRSKRRGWRRPRTAGEAGVDARGGIRVGLFPARRRHRHQERASMPTGGSSRGRSTTGTPATPASRRRTTSPRSRPSSTRRSRRCARARTARSPRRRTTTRARCTWTRWRARSASMRSRSGMRHLKDERMRAVLTRGRRADRLAEAVGRRARLGIACGTEKAGYVATAAEVARSGRRDGFKVERIVIAFECGAIVNPDGLQEPGRGLGRPGPRRRAVRGDRVCRRAPAQRHDGAVPRAALQGRAADRDHPAGPPRHSVGRRGRSVDDLPSRRRSARPSEGSGRSTRRCRSGCFFR